MKKPTLFILLCQSLFMVAGLIVSCEKESGEHLGAHLESQIRVNNIIYELDYSNNTTVCHNGPSAALLSEFGVLNMHHSYKLLEGMPNTKF